VFPGFASRIVGSELFTPPDIEDALGATGGDLDGGEIAPDQMFAFRPFADRKAPYTPVEGLYLAGRSATAAPFGGCVAGAVAAEAVIVDIAAGKLP
jgi:phytoene dehydrogenase-like protein